LAQEGMRLAFLSMYHHRYCRSAAAVGLTFVYMLAALQRWLTAVMAAAGAPPVAVWAKELGNKRKNNHVK
jgi:hypothetical protein